MKKLNMTKILFSIYCLLLIWIILFKMSFTFAEIKLLFGIRSINFIPFYYEDVVTFHFREVLLNVIIFIPFGLYLKMLDRTTEKSILYGFAFSFLLEICQFIFSVGASDITDIITNTFGTVLGVTSYAVIERCFHNKTKINKILNRLAFIATISIILLALLLFIANK